MKWTPCRFCGTCSLHKYTQADWKQLLTHSRKCTHQALFRQNFRGFFFGKSVEWVKLRKLTPVYSTLLYSTLIALLCPNRIIHSEYVSSQYQSCVCYAAFEQPSAPSNNFRGVKSLPMPDINASTVDLACKAIVLLYAPSCVRYICSCARNRIKMVLFFSGFSQVQLHSIQLKRLSSACKCVHRSASETETVSYACMIVIAAYPS